MKNAYEVLWIKDDEVICGPDWIMAKDEEGAKFISMQEAAEVGVAWSEEVRVLCRPFC